MDKVSIIVPCFNAEATLKTCLESIRNQSFSNIEVICIDDGSTDETARVLDAFSKDDARFLVFHQHHSGISQARNLGLSKANSEYLLFVDSDDWLEPNTLQVAVESIQDFDILMFSYYKNYTAHEMPKDLMIDGDFDAAFIQRRLVGFVEDEIKDFPSMDALATVWGKLYRKSIVHNVEFTELDEIGTWEDGLFNVHVLDNASKVRILNQPLYHYRKTNTQSYTSLFKEELPNQWERKFGILNTIIESRDLPFQEALGNRKVLTVLNLCFNEHHARKGFRETQRRIQLILNKPLYAEALKQFKLTNLPYHWQVFYFFVKKQNAFMVTLVSKFIYLVINRRIG